MSKGGTSRVIWHEYWAGSLRSLLTTFLYRLILAVELEVFFPFVADLCHAVHCTWLLSSTSKQSPARWSWTCNRTCLQMQSFEYNLWMQHFFY